MLASYLFAIAAVVVAGKLLLPLAKEAGLDTEGDITGVLCGVDFSASYDLYHWAFPVSVEFEFKYVELHVLFFTVGFNAWRW